MTGRGWSWFAKCRGPRFAAALVAMGSQRKDSGPGKRQIELWNLELWNRLHPRSATPKYFQGHVRLLGVTCRTTGWLLLKPLPVKLVPPNLAKDEVFFMFPNGKRI